MRLIAATLLTVVLGLVAVGCGGGGTRSRSRDKATPMPTEAIGGIDFARYWPRDEVVKLTPAERAKLLELSLQGMRGNNWEHARDVLLALGEHAVPALIAQVDSDEPSGAAAGPLPVVVEKGVKTVGQLSHDILTEIVQYHSSYKGQLPGRKRSAWETWWQKDGTGLHYK
jgi:hypothetical protein